MIVDRREVIKGLVVAGVSGMLTGKAVAAASTDLHAMTLHAVATASAQGEAFVEAARVAARYNGVDLTVLWLTRSLTEDFAQVNSLLARREPMTALVSPADGLLLFELARSNGRSVRFSAQHASSGTNGTTRHHLNSLVGASAFQGTSERAEYSALDGKECWASRLGAAMVSVASGKQDVFVPRESRSNDGSEELSSILIQG